MREPIYLETITAGQALPLRRLGGTDVPPPSCEHPLDDDARTRHFGVYVGDRLAGVASVTPEPPPGERDTTAWRVVGVATEPSFREAGLGALLIRACVNHASAQGADRLWCRPHDDGEEFLTRQGFQHRRASQMQGLPPDGLMLLAL